MDIYVKKSKQVDSLTNKKCEKNEDIHGQNTPNIDGIQYIPNFIDSHEESNLISDIDRQSWQLTLKRRTQHYGYEYDYKSRTIDARQILGDLPEWCKNIIERMQSGGIIQNKPDQVIVNEYQPGQGIAKHKDAVIFGEPVISLSLGSPCVMLFKKKNVTKSTVLAPRSLLILRGSSRWEWTHEIPARKIDIVDNKKIIRGRRISLTFRWLNKDK